MVDSINKQLIVAPPNLVSDIGRKFFFINDWYVGVDVEAPCAIKNLSGLEADGSLTLNLDDEVELVAQMQDDDEGTSWTVACGKASQTILHNAPDFVEYNKD